MAGFAQQFDGAWLRTRGRLGLVSRKIAAGAQQSVGDVVWTNWWTGVWTYVPPFIRDQAQLLRSTWLTAPASNSLPHIAPLVVSFAAPGTGGRGSVPWSNWWWNTPYQAPVRLVISLAPALYGYVGEPAQIGALHRYNLVLARADYAYVGGGSHSDFGITANTIPYALTGSFVTNPPYVLNALGISYSYSGIATPLKYGTPVRNPILTTSTRLILGPKRVSATVAPPFDFGGMMTAGDTISSATVTATIWSGVDPNPGAVYTGLITISGTIVYPTLQGGVPGVIYQLEVIATTGASGVLPMMAFLPVLPDSL